MAETQFAPNEKSNSLKKVMVAVDATEGSERAFRKAARMVDVEAGELYVVHVAEVYPEGHPGLVSLVNPLEDRIETVNLIEQRQQALLVKGKYEKLFEEVNQDRFSYIYIEGPSAREELCKKAAELGDVELLVVGSHGSSALAKLVLGSTADYIVNNAPCNVLIVKD